MRSPQPVFRLTYINRKVGIPNHHNLAHASSYHKAFSNSQPPNTSENTGYNPRVKMSLSISTTPKEVATTIRTLLSENLLSVFAERDAPVRKAAIERIYTDDVIWYETDGTVITGHAALDKRAGELLASNPGFAFSADGESVVTQNLGMLSWKFGPPGAPDLIKGSDFVIVEGGKIKALWTAITNVPSQ
ncbi:hypothetical protein B0H67DRAFT_135211 [Lasiosphaeris hirsuta]|uniref:SnoaL-like domain-containing protein n=1 Tax=Lasiosphaeris hirsuta TaxID=260670 RepID=A0AA40E3C7_9PEZI|nr:hypothetical protein B0H67DRAFT_135211 [Lasiosphaeris hirsuta]